MTQIAVKDTEKKRPLMEAARWTPADAAFALRYSVPYIRKLVKQGVFTVIANKGRGKGKKYYLIPEEVKIYAGVDGPAKLAEHRARQAESNTKRRK